MVAERASVHDGQYVAIQRRFNRCTKEMLADNEAVWHRSCYSSATNQTELQRARDRFEHSVNTGQYAMKKRGHKRTISEIEADMPGTSKPFTRSATDPLSKQLCVFCQSETVKLSTQEYKLWEGHQKSNRDFPGSSADDKVKQCNITKR